jgi:hypothetical protein
MGGPRALAPCGAGGSLEAHDPSVRMKGRGSEGNVASRGVTATNRAAGVCEGHRTWE